MQTYSRINSRAADIDYKRFRSSTQVLYNVRFESGMDRHLAQTRQVEQNRRNGKTTTPAARQDRQEQRRPNRIADSSDCTGNYQLQLVAKQQLVFTPQVEQKILWQYGLVNNYVDISHRSQELYSYTTVILHFCQTGLHAMH